MVPLLQKTVSADSHMPHHHSWKLPHSGTQDYTTGISWSQGGLEQRERQQTTNTTPGTTIDFLIYVMPLEGCIYPLSQPKSKVMEEYIEEALATGYIRPFTSPVAASFFFVSGINYQVLNSITVHYPYTLPLIPEANPDWLCLGSLQ